MINTTNYTVNLSSYSIGADCYNQIPHAARFLGKKVVVIGGGVLGSQIAFQSAYCGYDVTIWLRSEDSKTRTQPKLDALKKEIDRLNISYKLNKVNKK